MTLTRKHVSIGNFVCVALTLALMVCQFVPFWTVEETGEMLSIGALVGFPMDHPELTGYLEAACGEDYNINSVVIAPALIIALGAVGIALCMVKHRIAGCALVPAAVGAIGIWGYLSQAALKLGSGWAIHLVFCVALLIAGAATVCVGLKNAKK